MRSQHRTVESTVSEPEAAAFYIPRVSEYPWCIPREQCMQRIGEICGLGQGPEDSRGSLNPLALSQVADEDGERLRHGSQRPATAPGLANG